MLKTWFEIPLWQRVITALILGVLTGWAWGPEAESIKWIGDFFIKAIKMLVVPLIFFSLVSGVAAIGDLRKLGAVGGRAMLLFVVTGQIAVWMGLGLGTLVQPGAGLDTSVIQKGAIPEPNETTAVDMVLSIVPESPVQVMADVAVLPLIVFSLLIGIGILMAKEDGLPVQKVFDSGAVIMQKVTMIVMELTPFGVFALMAWVAGTLGLDALVSLAKLVGLNYLGCLLIIALIYGSMIKFLARLPVRDFFRGIVDAMAVSYSTASSNATLPVTLRCAERNLGVSNSVASFVISLGATINMNGTAMYLGLATLFGAQIFGVDLSMGDYFLISILATLGAVGAAGIPGAGLIMMALVFGAVGVPLETIAFVAGVDRIMDMMRTTTNVSGDAAVATTVAVMTGEIDTREMISADDV
ncbi:MAG: dicarboxylate/amino acid:cation symporter [Pseudomonadota bacterium]|uniref:dicarboxylate/amino acid:cation symporter n=1 Tax=Qipengyuania flava TaxID=192812 RepID=UPI001ADADBF1|nr:dicarboxylate/amino acid:cation symporter [Qipengyuania flava]MBO9504524.1 dicarboxylate/amino acid:cation symporter [Qipengyuania flava]MEC7422905.1 dicarboxylate/amino acid:cation symporter [Pseudomonadota bacterium]MEC8714287.1 dicarboxylate/amino acid:cation symporter [Pseudomonadota bacterium]MEE3218592.1 dicarboxylate/amino acid:cation symporter [Pseudomonadota bacterium]